MSSARRLLRPVPTLLAISRTAPPRPGFTLVEILVAVAISSVIILTAVACFRMVTNAVTAANVMSTENSLLRAGFQISLQDVDFWHSYADDKPPYNKGFMRVRSQLDIGSTDANDAALQVGNAIPENCWKRPFQPVRFVPRTDTSERDPDPASALDPSRNYSFYNASQPTLPHWYDINYADRYNDPYNRCDYLPNPNAMLAHDPRSISRTPLRVGHIPQEESGNGVHLGIWRNGYPRLAYGDYALVSASDARDVPGANNPRYPVDDPPSPPMYAPVLSRTPPTIVCANGDGPSPTYAYPIVTDSTPMQPIDIPLDPGWAMYQPLLWTDLFQRLNYYGCYEYMTPGTPLMFTDQHGRVPDINTTPLPPYTYDVLVNPPNWSGSHSINWFSYMWDRDFCFNFGNCDLATRMGERFIPSPSNGGWNARALEAIPLRPCWPMVTGLFDDGNFDSGAFAEPFTVFVGTGARQGGNNTENLGAGGQLWGHNKLLERADQSRADFSVISRTVWLPYNTTDAERADPDTGTALNPSNTDNLSAPRPLDYTTKPAQAPIMSTSIMRYGRVAGAQDLTVTRVTIEDPATGRKIELSCMPFGTTFRGARQHWRLYSKGLDTPDPPATGHRFGPPDKSCIGDFYDSLKGPYAAP